MTDAKRDVALSQNGGAGLDDTNPDYFKENGGPLVGTIWFFLMFTVAGIVFGTADYDTLSIFLGWRSIIAFAGYLIMQIGLWGTELKWDEEGSAAWIKAAGKDLGMTPEDYESLEMDPNTKIPDDQLKAAFPTPWGFLIGWWVWGISYLFPMDGTKDIEPSVFGIIALVVSFAVSFIASIPMSDAVMNRIPEKKKMLSIGFLLGWITLGVMSALDVSKYLDDNYSGYSTVPTWCLCMLGPFTIILSQQILFASRKMGTLWESSGKPNFHPIVYNMGGPLFVFGWFMLWLGTSGIPMEFGDNIYAKIDDKVYIPLFLNWRTILSFVGGCAMIPVVRFLDFSHDEDGPWCGENDDTPKTVFGKWWLGTDGTYFGLFLESPWPFVMAWTCFGFSSLLGYDNSFDVNIWSILIFINCLLQGIDAGILIQQNLYAGNMEGKNMFSKPFVLLFMLLAVNVGKAWEWRAIAFSLPGAILIILGQMTVFGARKRGDYTMQNNGAANPYNSVFVYTWGEVFFMMGWLLICWGMSFPNEP